MRTTRTLTVSLPPAMVEKLEKVREAESRTRSELVREALLNYFATRYPSDRPTQAEMAAIQRGRAAFKRGDSLSLDQLLNGMERRSHRPSRKKPAKTTGKRSSAH